MLPAITSRRLFVTAGGPTFQVFSFSQNKNDGSIYVSSPSFSEMKFLLALGPNHLSVNNSPGEGKLSLHGSGMVGARAHLAQHGSRLVMEGNYLLNLNAKSAGVRHLFTVLMAEPKSLPKSPARNRTGDVVIQVKELKPFVFVFFAVPAVKPIALTISASFQAEDLEEIPPMGGFGGFQLVHHTVAWFAYRTKHMARWAAEAQVSYHDGYHVPVWSVLAKGMPD